MNTFGVPQQRPMDPFGLAYASTINAVPQLQAHTPVRPAMPMPAPIPVMETPRLLAQQFLGLPRVRAQAMMRPAEQLMPRLGMPPSRYPLSPRRPGAEGLPELSPEQITDIVRRTESTNNYQALNTDDPGNTASGAYQYTDGTWNNYGGYAKAMYAPPEVQDRRFAEDLAARMRRHNGDPFRVIAAHYLPAYADNPEIWNQSLEIKGRKVQPIATYVRKVIKGTPLEGHFDAYLGTHGNK